MKRASLSYSYKQRRSISSFFACEFPQACHLQQADSSLLSLSSGGKGLKKRAHLFARCPSLSQRVMHFLQDGSVFGAHSSSSLHPLTPNPFLTILFFVSKIVNNFAYKVSDHREVAKGGSYIEVASGGCLTGNRSPGARRTQKGRHGARRPSQDFTPMVRLSLRRHRPCSLRQRRLFVKKDILREKGVQRRKKTAWQ